jgi:ssDNA thymidine ADP-ribosyltransferase, DarT
MPMTWWGQVKEERQAEFLVRDFFPWACILEIAVATEATAQRARSLLVGTAHQPPVIVRRPWYY